MLDSLKRRTRRPSAGAVIGLVALVAALGGGAYAAIPGADGQIKGCYATSNGLLLGIPHSKGDLRAVDENESCRSYERSLTWSQGGPPRTTSVVIRNAQGGLSGGERFGSVIARCQAGEVATGGGYRGSANTTAIDDTEPVDDGTGTPVGWRVGISRAPGSTLDPHVVAWVVCATL